MGFTVYSGNVRQGKSIRLTRKMLDHRAQGRDVHVNYLIGHRVLSYFVPICAAEGCAAVGFCTIDDARAGFGPSVGPLAQLQTRGHTMLRYEVRPRTPVLDYAAKWCDWREGRALVHDPENFPLLTEWEQLIALRVGRDEYGTAHRMQLHAVAEYVAETGEIRHHWKAVPGCNVARCRGCSKGITIGWDEIHHDMDARAWAALGGDMSRRLSYSGKDGLDIYATVQNENNIDVVARRLFTEIIVCRKINVLGLFALFTYEPFNPVLLTDKARSTAVEGAHRAGFFSYDFGLIDRTAAESFDTYERVRRFVRGEGPAAAAPKRETKDSGVTVEARQLIASHVAGNHKKAARTCPVCQVAALDETPAA